MKMFDSKILASSHINLFFGARVNGNVFPQINKFERSINKLNELLIDNMKEVHNGTFAEGRYGMKLVGNVTVNRVKAKCGTFKNVNTLTRVIYQKGQYAGTKIKLFNGPANGTEKKLAKACIDYWKGSPATNALFYRNPGNISCPRRFYGPLSGRYKKHCFYNSDNPSACGI